MISKKEQADLRNILFRHLDGIVTAPTAYELMIKGVTKYLLEKEKCSLNKLTVKFQANEGYLNVALRILCSQGWLNQQVDNQNDEIIFSTNESSEVAFNYFHLYEEAVKLLKLTEKYHTRKFEKEPFIFMEKIFEKYIKQYEIISPKNESEKLILNQILKHIEGIILGPTLVHLGMSGMFHKYFMQVRFKPEEFHKDGESFGKLLDILVHFGWFDKDKDSFQFTEKGLFFAKRASAYGVTVSYIPTLRKLDELLFRNPNVVKSKNSNSEEIHVDREMNVWGSGGAHASYFKVVDQIIIEIFNRPIEEQPKGILDMGCGNGAFLQHLFNVIDQQTLRGTLLEEHPLFLIGADYNDTALKISKANLIQADIWAKIVWGDIGRPDLLSEDLKKNYDIDLKDLLNVRTFLDHNRIWEMPKEITPSRVSNSTGAYAFEGKRISNNRIEDSLKEHFQKWSPFVKKFGLLLVELHTVKPEIVAQNIGKAAVTAYDATHGYSDQYIVEVDVFNDILEQAGLVQNQNLFRKFPNSELATVTVNLFKSKDS